jgi:DNA-binding transcriptional LysR family regulator
MQTNSDVAIHEAVLAGHGLAYVPEFMVSADIATGRLQVILQDYCQQQRGIYVLYPNQQNLPLKVRAFVDFISDNIGLADMFAS